MSNEPERVHSLGALCPELSMRIELLNEAAWSEERDGCVNADVAARADALSNSGLRSDRSVYAWDIDLTLMMPDDDDGFGGEIKVSELHALRDAGAVVGTCSDRIPSEQLAVMGEAGFEPDFAISKELLGFARRLLGARSQTLIGDDPARDREMALFQGWEHVYLWDWAGSEARSRALGL